MKIKINGKLVLLYGASLDALNNTCSEAANMYHYVWMDVMLANTLSAVTARVSADMILTLHSNADMRMFMQIIYDC